MLSIIIGARFDESLSTPGRAIEVQSVHFRSTHFQLGHLHSSLVREQITESAAFFNLDDDFHPLERRGQHIICKLELIHIFSFHVNYLVYLSWFLIVSAVMHLTIVENNLKCYKRHNHTSFFDELLLDVVEEVLKNKSLRH